MALCSRARWRAGGIDVDIPPMQGSDPVRPLIGITCDLDLGGGRETRAPGRRADVLHDDYVQAILAAGGLPLLLPTHVDVDRWEAYAALLHGLLIPGNPADVDPACYGEEPHPRMGPMNPMRSEFEMQMV